MRKNSSDEEKKPEPKPLPKKIDHSALESMLKAQQSQAQAKEAPVPSRNGGDDFKKGLEAMLAKGP